MGSPLFDVLVTQEDRGCHSPLQGDRAHPEEVTRAVTLSIVCRARCQHPTICRTMVENNADL